MVCGHPVIPAKAGIQGTHKRHHTDELSPMLICVVSMFNHYFGYAKFITATPYLMQVLRPMRDEPLEPTALVSFQMLQWKTLTYFNLKAGF